jgi:hypothetical protein
LDQFDKRSGPTCSLIPITGGLILGE